MDSRIRIELTPDHALVLFELFARFQETHELELRHNAEFVALSSVTGQLESVLVEPFDPDYGRLLAEAQERVGAGYEGLAPGVRPVLSAPSTD